MGIARPPANSPKYYIESSEGLNIDQWQSLNINKFVPEVFQEVVDQVKEIIDTAQAVIELAAEALKLLAALTSELFDLIKAIIEALAQAIKDLLDLFPKLDAGIYFLYVNTDFGGIDYFTRTFENSLTDRFDPMRPPSDNNIPFRTMFFLWGYPWFNKEKMQALGEIESTFKSLFGLNGRVPDSGDVPSPDNFAIQKAFFVKPKEGVEQVTNTIDLPENEVVDGFRNKLRTTIQKTSRKSGTKGVSHNISWDIPEDFSSFGRERTTYDKEVRANNIDKTTNYIFTKKTLKIIGIDILRAEDLVTLEKVKLKLLNNSDNAFSFQGEDYEDQEGAFLDNTYLIHRSLSFIPGTDNFVHIPPEAEDKEYYYAASYVYQFAISQVWVTKNADGSFDVDQVINYDYANSTKINSNVFDDISDANFASLDPLEINYPDVDFADENSFVGPPTQVVPVYAPTQTAPSGTPPDWISFKALGDLFPELQRFIDQAKNVVDNITNELIDDVDSLNDFIQEYIRDLERKLKQADDLLDLLNSLIFPPMAGIYYLNLNTQYGMPKIVERYKRSLELGLRSTEDGYNPLLLDRGFQAANPREYEKRVNIPAFDDNHKVGGFILAFQEPAIQGFLEDLFALKESFTDEFQQILNDSRLRLSQLKLPELREISVPTHPFVELLEYEYPDQYMQERAKYTSGTDQDPDPVNERGNIELKSNPGPYINDGPPMYLNIQCSDDGENYKWNNILIPKGTITATQIANLISCDAAAVDDGSFVIEAKYLFVSPCSEKAAEIVGLVPGTVLQAVDQNPVLDGDVQEFDEGDLVVEFVNNGRADVEQRIATPPIFQLNPIRPELLTPLSHMIKITVEGEEQIVDVTGNAGANPIDRSPLWDFGTTFPLTLVEEDIPNSVVGNNTFEFQIFGVPVENEGLPTTPQTVTLQPVTYRDIRSLSAEILRALGDAGLPLGMFSTTPNETLDAATLFFTDSWAQTGSVYMAITPLSADFLGELTTNVVTPGTDYQAYTVTEIVDNLNAAFTTDPFTVQGQSVRITGETVGPTGEITVHTSNQNSEYALVSQAVFGFNDIQVADTTVYGLGSKRTTSEYIVENDVNFHCSELLNHQSYETEFVTQFYEVEIQQSQQQEYEIEFV